jgi:hypothetical protein
MTSANLVSALHALAHQDRVLRFNGLVPGSRPTAKQQELLDAILNREALVINCRSGNRAGKSLTLCKALATMFTEDPAHPWRRPSNWVGPLLLLVLGRQSKQLEDSILPKILAHVPQGTCGNPKRNGNVIQKLVNEKNGNTILFFSHHEVRGAAQGVQSFDAHFAAIDELPSDPMLIEEVMQRVYVQKGCMALTYTPKIPAPKVKKFLENLPDDKVKHINLSPLDNPAIDEQTKQTILSTAMAQGANHMATVIEGAWMVGDRQVFTYDPSQHMIEIPQHYHPQTWRHVLTVDPASASATGVLVTAEDPNTGAWLVVHASHIEEREPAALVQKVEAIATGYRITRRIYDSAATWYEGTARAAGHRYMPIDHKAGRKVELIQNVNLALGTKLFLTPAAEALEEELQSAQWSESARENIAHGHEYHLPDCLQYFLELMPPREHGPAPEFPSYHAAIRAHNHPANKPEAKSRCRSIRSSRQWLRR